MRLYWFNKYVLRYPDINERVHAPMCDFYQPQFDKNGENDFAMDLEPRNTMKTTFCIVGGATWLLAKNPNERILLLASSHEEAKKRLRAIKSQMEQKRLVEFFFYNMARNMRSKTSWKSESITVYNRTSLDLEPSIDTGGRGTDKVGNHYTAILVDDIETSDTAISEEERETTRRCLDRLSPCLQPKWSILRITGTRWAYDDAYSRILGEHEIDRGRFDFYRIRVKSAYNPDGTLYYPERLSEAYLERERKNLLSYLFSCNYLNSPMDDTASAFPSRNTMYYYGELVREGTAKYIHVERVTCAGDNNYKWMGGEKCQIRLFICVDPALSQQKQGCYTGIVVCGKGVTDNRLWVIDAVQLKSQDPYMIIDTLIMQYLKYDPLAIIIEDCVWQRALASFFDGECKKQHIYPRVETVGRSDHRSKDERVLGLSSYWKANAIMLPVKTGAVENLIQELHHFPKSRTRDLSDAFSRILDIKYGVQTQNVTNMVTKWEKEYRQQWMRRA